MSRAWQWVVAASFVAASWLPMVAMVVPLDPVAAMSENRVLQDRPRLSLRPRELISFPGKFRYYFSDHFGFRAALIRAHWHAMVQGLGVTSSQKVTMGKDGWLFLASEREVESFRRTDLFTDAQLDAWRAALERRRAWLAQRGIDYVFVIAPDKQTIYPERMPDALTQVAPVSRLDQLMERMRGSPVNVVDLRAALLAAKNDGRIYHKTDTHWNDRGAFVAYQTLMAALPPTVHARVLRADEFAPVEHETPGMDLARLMGGPYREDRLDLRPLTAMAVENPEQDNVSPVLVRRNAQDAAALPPVVVFRDSFFTNVVSWLSTSFGDGVYLWQDLFDPAWIDRVKPTLVIEELAERKLMVLDPGAGAI